MDKGIARLNIDHYRKLLATESDETKRRTLQKLLAEEEAKLAVGDLPKQKRGYQLIARAPLTPMGGLHVNMLFGFRVDPAVQNATARKHERVRSGHRQSKV